MYIYFTTIFNVVFNVLWNFMKGSVLLFFVLYKSVARKYEEYILLRVCRPIAQGTALCMSTLFCNTSIHISVWNMQQPTYMLFVTYISVLNAVHWNVYPFIYVSIYFSLGFNIMLIISFISYSLLTLVKVMDFCVCNYPVIYTFNRWECWMFFSYFFI